MQNCARESCNNFLLPFDKKLYIVNNFMPILFTQLSFFSLFIMDAVSIVTHIIMSRKYIMCSNWLLGSYFNVCPYYPRKCSRQFKISNDFLSLIKNVFWKHFNISYINMNWNDKKCRLKYRDLHIILVFVSSLSFISIILSFLTSISHILDL